MENELQQYLNDVKIYFSLFKESIGMFKATKDLLPDSPEKEAALKSLDEAEKKAQVAEASLAKSLGFILCPKCWPPTILNATFVGSSSDNYKCSSCGTSYVNHGKRNNRISLREFVPEQTDQ